MDYFSVRVKIISRGGTMKLSILDFVTIYEGVSDVDSMNNMLETVKVADELGYHRYWFTEHHSMSSLLSTAPDLMIAAAIAVSKRIRLGAGGIMLPNHAALKVAENFRLLSIMAPDRIDLGIGRAPGTNQQAAFALSRLPEVAMRNNFNQQLEDLLGFLNSDTSDDIPFSSIQMPGFDMHNPEVMMLGFSKGGVEFALEHNLPFVFAGHINPALMEEVLLDYNQRKQGLLDSVAAIGVVCAKDDETAALLAEPYIHMWVKRMSGDPSFKRHSVEEVKDYVYSDYEMMVREAVLDKLYIGSVETLKVKFEALLNNTKASEIMMVDCYPNHEAKMKGYRLLAELLEPIQ